MSDTKNLIIGSSTAVWTCGFCTYWIEADAKPPKCPNCGQRGTHPFARGAFQSPSAACTAAYEGDDQ